MSLESNEIVVGSFGHVYRAPLGTSFPTNISTAVPSSPWLELGYLTEEGVRFNFAREVNEFFGWQSYHPLRVISQRIPTEVMFDCTQLNANTWMTAMGGGTLVESPANNFLYEPPGEEENDQFELIVEWQDGTLDYRLCLRKVQNMSGVEFALTRENPIILPITVKMLAPDTDVSPWFLQTDDENLGDFLVAGS
jgi:hypothetical protein